MLKMPENDSPSDMTSGPWKLPKMLKMPERWIEGKHTGHDFDEEYCYDCKEIVDDTDPDPKESNWKFNKALDEVTRLNKDRVEGLVRALEAGLISHENLYKQCFGEIVDPNDDCIYREMKAALQSFREEK